MKCILLLLNGKENLASRVRYFSVDPPIHGYSLEHHKSKRSTKQYFYGIASEVLNPHEHFKQPKKKNETTKPNL